jgi:hypothetical protein
MPAKTQLSRIEDGLFGNGHEGLLSRTARMEENIKHIGDDVIVNSALADAANKKAIATAEAALQKFDEHAILLSKMDGHITNLTTSVDTHHKSLHLLDVLKKPKFYWSVVTIYLVSFIILHLIATYVPDVWDWLMKLFGLPGLIIPLL